jgi:hypothetical protein
MPKYDVTFYRTIRVICHLSLNAQNEDTAEKKAEDLAEKTLENYIIQLSFEKGKGVKDDLDWEFDEEDVDDIEITEA